jgi:NAD(P)-dependent dehydrogenase (short-subunit alcohol dehydrogenase family)
MTLSGTTTIVTGTSRGFGHAIALIEAGTRVIGVSRSAGQVRGPVTSSALLRFEPDSGRSDSRPTGRMARSPSGGSPSYPMTAERVRRFSTSCQS